jgi:hypothetical protein
VTRALMSDRMKSKSNLLPSDFVFSDPKLRVDVSFDPKKSD